MEIWVCPNCGTKVIVTCFMLSPPCCGYPKKACDHGPGAFSCSRCYFNGEPGS